MNSHTSLYPSTPNYTVECSAWFNHAVCQLLIKVVGLGVLAVTSAMRFGEYGSWT